MTKSYSVECKNNERVSSYNASLSDLECYLENALCYAFEDKVSILAINGTVIIDNGKIISTSFLGVNWQDLFAYDKWDKENRTDTHWDYIYNAIHTIIDALIDMGTFSIAVDYSVRLDYNIKKNEE